MSVLSNLANRIANAVQPDNNSKTVDNFFSRDPFKLLALDKNFNGRYDNYYPDANRIVQVAAQYPIYLVDEDNGVSESSFAEALENPNSSYPRRKVYEQIYTELITTGESNIFIWHKQGKEESSHYDKKFDSDNFTGFTLVSGYDTSRLTKRDKEDIVKLTYGVNQSNVFLGYSPTQAANAWRKMQDAMGAHSTSFASNSGMPMGTFIITAQNEEQYLGVKKELAKRTVGAKNAGKVLFSYKPSSSQEAQIQWVQFTSKDAQDYTAQLEYADKKIGQNFGVPGIIKATNDEANYATASVSRASFIEFTIKPLVDSVAEQLDFYLKQRFTLVGKVVSNVEVPTIADEAKVEAEATKTQIEIFDQKLLEGWTAESIVAAYNLPKRFLLLELPNGKTINENAAKKGKVANVSKKKDELVRRYMNQLSTREMNKLEKSIREITQAYATTVLLEGINEANRLTFEANLAENYGIQYESLYKKAATTLTDDLLELFDSIDVSLLDLTDEELTVAISKYSERVAAFSTTFTDNVASLPGDTLQVRERAAKPHVERVVVTEAEHTRAESELDVYVKGQRDYDVKIFKTWQTQGDAKVCQVCLDLENTQIDVTALFDTVNENTVFESTAGLAHPNCRCFVEYKTEKA